MAEVAHPFDDGSHDNFPPWGGVFAAVADASDDEDGGDECSMGDYDVSDPIAGSITSLALLRPVAMTLPPSPAAMWHPHSPPRCRQTRDASEAWWGSDAAAAALATPSPARARPAAPAPPTPAALSRRLPHPPPVQLFTATPARSPFSALPQFLGTPATPIGRGGIESDEAVLAPGSAIAAPAHAAATPRFLHSGRKYVLRSGGAHRAGTMVSAMAAHAAAGIGVSTTAVPAPPPAAVAVAEVAGVAPRSRLPPSAAAGGVAAASESDGGEEGAGGGCGPRGKRRSRMHREVGGMAHIMDTGAGDASADGSYLAAACGAAVRKVSRLDSGGARGTHAVRSAHTAAMAMAGGGGGADTLHVTFGERCAIAPVGEEDAGSVARNLSAELDRSAAESACGSSASSPTALACATPRNSPAGGRPLAGGWEDGHATMPLLTPLTGPAMGLSHGGAGALSACAASLRLHAAAGYSPLGCVAEARAATGGRAGGAAAWDFARAMATPAAPTRLAPASLPYAAALSACATAATSPGELAGAVLTHCGVSVSGCGAGAHATRLAAAAMTAPPRW